MNCGWGVSCDALEEVERYEDGKGGVAIVERNREDAVDAEDGERKREEEEGGYPDCGSPLFLRERAEQDAPGEDCTECSGDGSVEHVVEDDAAGELDDGSLNEESERRVGEGEIAVRNLAEGDAEG